MLRHLLDCIFSLDIHRSVWRNFNWIPVLFTLGLVSGNWGTSVALADPLTDTQTQTETETQVEDSIENQNLFFKDGIYLYGQSPQPHQLGQAYMVFEVTQGRLVGGFYMPRSSFDCFSGTPQGNQLALSIIDSYTQQAHDYSVRYSNSSTVAASTPTGADDNITLEGFYPIEILSQTDYHILKTCKADFNQN